MDNTVKTQGIVLLAQPVGEYDKRLVIQTRELGKITAFAQGCRRPGNALQAAAAPFVTGEFSLYPRRDSYRLAEVSVSEYFRELAGTQPEVYMGFYFLELTSYYGRENIDGTDMLNLLFLSLKALLNKKLDARLVRRIFELRLMSVNGEFAADPSGIDDSLYQIVRYITNVQLRMLYSFVLTPDKMAELEKYAEKVRRKTIDKNIKSLGMVDMFYD